MSQCLTMKGPCHCDKPRAYWCPTCKRYICRVMIGHVCVDADALAQWRARMSVLSWLNYRIFLVTTEETVP